MKAAGVKLTEGPKAAREGKAHPKGDTIAGKRDEQDGQAERQPKFLPISRWGVEELEAVLAGADGGPATAKAGSAAATVRVVRFELLAPTAREVFLAGSFNNWNPGATPMARSGRVRWVKELSLPPGRCEYRFLVDGKWKEDPKAADYMPNSSGGFNSVRQVK
jgi:hypothetical protein